MRSASSDEPSGPQGDCDMPAGGWDAAHRGHYGCSGASSSGCEATASRCCCGNARRAIDGTARAAGLADLGRRANLREHCVWRVRAMRAVRMRPEDMQRASRSEHKRSGALYPCVSCCQSVTVFGMVSTPIRRSRIELTASKAAVGFGSRLQNTYASERSDKTWLEAAPCSRPTPARLRRPLDDPRRTGGSISLIGGLATVWNRPCSAADRSRRRCRLCAGSPELSSADKGLGVSSEDRRGLRVSSLAG